MKKLYYSVTHDWLDQVRAISERRQETSLLSRQRSFIVGEFICCSANLTIEVERLDKRMELMFPGCDHSVWKNHFMMEHRGPANTNESWLFVREIEHVPSSIRKKPRNSVV